MNVKPALKNAYIEKNAAEIGRNSNFQNSEFLVPPAQPGNCQLKFVAQWYSF